MAHTQLPNLLYKLINTSNMCPTDFAGKTSLPDLLQSDPVKRLFNQPNIIIKTVPLKPPTALSSNSNVAPGQGNNLSAGLRKTKPSDLSVFPVRVSSEEDKEDENLLPSKKNGKSEITLVPIKRIKKPCGHYEPCESIVCDVAVQQYADRNGVSPMLAFNIEEGEINAPVSRHCASKICDALSIDHNRCRRAVVRLNKCDRSAACDICGVTLKTQKFRVVHKNCTRKYVYRHNETSSAQIMRVRMRERELQLMEAAKLRKNDYLDPVRGFNLTMETLKNNKELIVIPKSQTPSVTVTNKSTQQVTSANNIFGTFLSSIPLVLPQPSIVVEKSSNSNQLNVSTPVQVALPDLTSGPILTTAAVPFTQSQYVTFTTQSAEQPIKLNDILLSQSQIVTTPIQTKSLITPIRVVPITNLITEPSLLHQTQGIPKFCIMADHTITVSNSQPIQPAPVPKAGAPVEPRPAAPKKKKFVRNKRRKCKKKDFKCKYCLKHFSTDWYFKIHVATHEGETTRFTCKTCEQPFNSRHDMRRHVSREHKNETARKQGNVEQSHRCGECNIAYARIEDLKHHKRKCHEKTECTFCGEELFLEDLDDHVESVHKYQGEEKLLKKSEESLSDGCIKNIVIKEEFDIDDTETNGYFCY